MEVRKDRLYTIADIEALPEGKRAELIDGVMYDMAAPTREHQDIVTGMTSDLYQYVKNNKGICKVYASPFAVYLQRDDTNYFEPDIVVVCDPDKLDNKGCHGAPDLIVEVVSPESIQRDYMIKLFRYHNAGVREYWIVDPLKQMVRVYDFEHEQTQEYQFTDKIQVGLYAGLQIRVADYLE